MTSFRFTGTYRVQSRKTGTYSELEGVWLPGTPLTLDSNRVNAVLIRHPLWRGQAAVEMRPADIRRRSGQFESEPDILYKKSFFIPTPSSPPMTVNIVDVRKSEHNWRIRTEYAIELFGRDAYECVVERLDDLQTVIVNEYYLHEAGHFLGYDVLSKYVDGYFSVAGRAAWPLIYVEEFRADMHSFGFAIESLPRHLAVQVFLYNVFLRFGVHLQGIRERGIECYGAVPLLLFHLLRKLGFASVERLQGRAVLTLESFDEEQLIDVMARCSDHAASELTAAEMTMTDQLDLAIHADSYAKSRLLDEETVAEFHALMKGL